MLSPTLPWPLNMGSKIRIYHVLRELARAGHEVTLLALAHEPYGPDDLVALKAHCQELHVIPVKNRPRLQAAVKSIVSGKPYRVAKFESREFKQAVAQALQRDYDILWVHFLETLAYIPQMPARNDKALVLVDQHNADELMWRRFVKHKSWGSRLFAMFNLRRLKRFQSKVIGWVDVLLEVSQGETEFVRQRVPSSIHVWTVPNGVDINYFSPTRLEKHEPVILFCGGLDRLRNIEAVKRFAKQIFPLVKKAVTEAQFWIVGRNPVGEVLALQNNADVCIYANVDDVRPFYENAKVAVIPVRLGGGTKLKAFEALAMGVPVVTTPDHGIDGASELYVRVGKDDEEFALQVIGLLRDETRRVQAARAGLEFVRKRYSWQAIMGDVEAKLEKLVKQGGRYEETKGCNRRNWRHCL